MGKPQSKAQTGNFPLQEETPSLPAEISHITGDIRKLVSCLLDGIEEAAFITDRSGRIQIWNQEFEALHRISLENAQDKPVEEVLPPGYARWVRACIETDASSKEEGPAQRHYKQWDGKQYWIETTVTALRGCGVMVIDRIQMDPEDRAISALEDNIPVGMFRATVDGQILSVNHSMVRLLGYPNREKLLETPAAALYFQPSQREEWFDQEEQTGSVNKSEFRARRLDGHSLDLVGSIRAIYDLEGQISYLEGSVEDITELKRIEQAQRESEETYRTIFENTPVASTIIDGLGKISLANTQFVRFAGYDSRDEIEGKVYWTDFLIAEEIERFQRQVLAGINLSPEPLEFRFSDRNGKQAYTLVTASPISGTERKVISVLDISEQKQSQQVYKRLAEKMAGLHAISTASSEVDSVDELIDRATQVLEDLFHPAHCGVLLVDRDRNIIRLHPSYRGITPRISEIPLEMGISGWVIAHGQTRRVIDTLETPEYISPGDELMRSELCAPLKLSADVIGVVNVEASLANAFSLEDEDLVATLSVQLATAIDRLRSQKVQRHQAEQLAVIDQVSREIARASQDLEKVYLTIHKAVAKLMPSESFALTLYDEGQEEIVAVYLMDKNGHYPLLRMPVGQGMTGMVIRTGQPLYIKDMDTLDGSIPVVHYGSPDHIRSALTVPLRLGEKTIGAMSTQSYLPQAFTLDDLHILELLSNHVAIALENARLFEETHLQVLTFENMFDAIIISSAPDGKILDWNPAATRMYGYSKEEAVGRSINIIHKPHDIPGFEQNLIKDLRTNGRFSGENEFVRKDGSVGRSELVVLPIYNNQGELVSMIGLNRDITERKQAEEALRKNEALLRLVLNTLPVGVWLTDIQGQMFSANPAAMQIWGSDSSVDLRRIGEFKGWWPKTGEALTNEDWASTRAIQKGETSLNEEIDILTFDGVRKTILNSAIPILDEQKNVTGAIIVNTDMTEEKQREREREAILTVSAALRSASTRDEMVMIVALQLSTLITAEGIAVLLHTPERGQNSYTLGAAQGNLNSLRHAQLDLEGNLGQYLDKIRNKQVNLNLEEDFPELSHLTNCHGFLVAVPLETRDGILGAVWLVKATEFSPLEVSVTTAVAEITANALHRLALYERTRRYAGQLRVVSEIGHTLTEMLDLPEIYSKLAEGVLKLFPDSAAVFIAMYQPEHELITCAYGLVDGKMINPLELPPVHLAPPGEEQQSDVIRRRSPVIATDLMGTVQIVALIGERKPETTQSALFVPMLSRGEVLGVLQIQSYSPNRYSQEDADMLGLAANTAGVAIENANLFQKLQQTNSELTLAYEMTLEGWAHALELRDQETKEHSQRVVDFTQRLARRLGMNDQDLIHVRRGALLHDIGKMGISDQILNKHGPLSEEDWVKMRMHPVYAYEMLKSIGYLGPALDIPYCHHEKWDGSGYPRGLAGKQIPVAARIFAVVDVWDALITDRPYRPAWTQEQALNYIREQAGQHFDPQVVIVFLEMIDLGD